MDFYFKYSLFFMLKIILDCSERLLSPGFKSYKLELELSEDKRIQQSSDP